VTCSRCSERIPDDADVIEDLYGSNVCPSCHELEKEDEKALLREMREGICE
jgi:hypothetical protein